MEKICIIIPCFNEQDRLPVREFDDFIGTSDNVYFCLVNDGSSDNTEKVLNTIYGKWPERIRVLSLPENMGKAEAVRQGVFKALEWTPFDYLGYFDADLSTPFSEISLLLDNINRLPTYQMAFGSRVKRLGAYIVRNEFRHYLSRIIATIISMILRVPVYDTQCGAKLLRTKIAADIFAEPFLSRWLFDVEIFARIIKMSGRDNIHNIFIEVPLRQWINKSGTKIKPYYLFKIPLELSRIHLKYKK